MGELCSPKHRAYIVGEPRCGPLARYSPPVCTAAQRTPITGKPDPKHISTSYIERQNLTVRMGLRRFTRLTNAFSKKIENHACAIALHFMYYNFARVHQSLKTEKGYQRTPAMVAGIADHVWSVEEIVELLDSNLPTTLALSTLAFSVTF